MRNGQAPDYVMSVLTGVLKTRTTQAGQIK
jgi:hypothetical protein